MSIRIGRWLCGVLLLGLGAAHAQVDTRASFVVEKFWDPEGSAVPVEIEIRCNTGLPLEQTFLLRGERVEFVVTHFDSGELDCRISEVAAPGFSQTYLENGNVVPLCEYENVLDGLTFTCSILNVLVESRAAFTVEKVFTDGNPGSVEVEIECNTGLPVSQSYMVPGGGSVTFVVTHFDSGELDCRVTETVPTGYVASYFDGTTSAVNCEWDDVPSGARRECVITNFPDEPDSDGDGFTDSVDNCPDVSNQDQADSDGDGIGDACDPLMDSDGDGVDDEADQCPNTADSGLVNPETGCSLEQLCPCNGDPDTNEAWQNQGQYLRCVIAAVRQLEYAGVISHFQALDLSDKAKASGCGG